MSWSLEDLGLANRIRASGSFKLMGAPNTGPTPGVFHGISHETSAANEDIFNAVFVISLIASRLRERDASTRFCIRR